MTRPTGTPGTLHLAKDYPAILDHDGELWAMFGGAWVEFETGWQSLFTPDDVPDWVTRCEHEPICDTEGECDRQAIADDRQARAEDDRG